VNTRLTTRAQKLVVGGAATIVAGIIAAFAIHFTLAWREGQARQHMTGTVYLAVDGNTCRRLVIDHRTATVTSDERVPCVDQGKDQTKEQARAQKEAPRAQKDASRGPKGPVQGQDGSDPARYSTGGRLDAVRNSFINR
jgi:hypothetical protein